MKMDDFLARVLGQMKSKAGRELVEKELRHHLNESSKAYKKAGYMEEEASAKAVQDMGDPDDLGLKMNRLHRPVMDWPLLIVAGLLLAISMLPVFLVKNEIGGIMTYQWLSLFASSIVLVGCMLFPYEKLLSWWKIWLAMGMGILLLTLMPIFSLTVNGKVYFSPLGGTMDMMVVNFLLLLGWIGYLLIAKRKPLPLTILLVWLPVMFLTFLTHYIAAFAYFSLSLFTYFLKSSKQREKITFLLVNVCLLVIAVTFYISIAPQHQIDRVLGWLRPEQYSSSFGYIPFINQDLLQHSVFFGRGSSQFAQTMVELRYNTDLVLLFLIHEIGWVPALSILALFVYAIVRFVRTSRRTPDLKGSVLVIGATTLIVVPLMMGVFMNIGWLPIIEHSVPILSFGIGQQMYYSGLIGIILNVYRHQYVVIDRGLKESHL
ncbi:BH3360 [Halalkalibacterium halodurans C-125]|uniref:BH3360 protein n=2 Tax=Halalkalibacterium halodurans TaxID=86665 RepID=Q9K7K1_HALH5|nr:BH3360 [Halalkalibacterium halodurans C-125]